MNHIIKKAKNTYQSIIKEFRPLLFDKAFAGFVRHNKKIWKDFSYNNSESEVLFEFTTMQPNIISCSYFANVLAKKFNAAIKVYSFGENMHTNFSFKRLYKSFNGKSFQYCLNSRQRIELEELFNDIYPQLSSKKDVFDLHVFNIWVGDLLYDYHLITYKVPTVDVNDNRFKVSLKRALYQLIFWRDYFDSHDVKAVNVSHCCYLVAIPMRIAVHSGIPAYQVNAYGGFCIKQERLWAYADFYDYPELFGRLSPDEQSKGLTIAQDRIARRFAGEIGVDMPYSKKSAYTEIKKDRVLSDNNKFKILVAAHCFFDSPNGIGPNLFVDFYEWFEFMGMISKKTDYDWYIKTHPDYLPGNIEIINNFITKYPKFKLIPADTSHHQLIDEGINCVLTTYGTIGWEYAALGKLVINASVTNPHIAYNFNIHPRSIDEYEQILLSLPEQEIDIDINEVYEYYYMNLRRDKMSNWLFNDYDSFIENIGGYINLFTSITYQKFIEEFSYKRHQSVLDLLNSFISSGDYCMQKNHYMGGYS